MRRIETLGIAAVAVIAACAVTAITAWGISPPYWGGKGAKGAVICEERSSWVLNFGFDTKELCEMSPASRGRLGFGGWTHPIFGIFQAKGAQRFSNTLQSVECSGLESRGGFYKEEEPLELEGASVLEFIFSGCTVWEGAFKSELKECHVTSLEGGFSTGKTGVINFSAAGELVYLNKEGTKIGDLFSDTAKKFANLDFTGSGCIKSNSQELLGEVLAELAPENQEVASIKVTFPTTAKTACWKWILPSTLKACATVKLVAYGLTTTQSGESSYRLTSKEVFGAFN